MKYFLIFIFSVCTWFSYAQSQKINVSKQKAQPISKLNSIKKPVVSDPLSFKDDPLNIKQYKLANGLTVVLSENHDNPSVFGMMMVKAGAKDEKEDATGLAHYLEHMLFKGTETMGTIDYQKEKPHLDLINDLYDSLGLAKDENKRKEIQKQINTASIKAGEFAIPNEMDKILGQMGSSGVNAFTSEDYTAYHNTFPSSQLEKWLEVYAHRFEKPVFRLFQSELETVYEEKNRAEDFGFYKVFETFQKNLFPEHPYGKRPVIGYTEHLKNPPLKRMYEFFNTYYVPNNMVLILSGSFNSDQCIKWIEEKFGAWKNSPLPESPTYNNPPFESRKLVKVKMTPIKAGLIGFHTVNKSHPDYAGITVINELLSNKDRSGLIDNLSTNGKVMTAGMFPLTYNDLGATVLFFVPKIVGQKLEDAENLVLNELKKVTNGEFSDTMLNSVKLSIRNELELAWEDNEERVLTLAEVYSTGKSWEDFITFIQKIQSLSREEVIDISKKYFGDNYLCLYTNMGVAKKDKIEKPGFEPVIPKNEIKSEFRHRLDKIPSSNSEAKYLNFDEDYQSIDISNNITLSRTNNPYNQLFTLDISWGYGSWHNRALQYLPSYADLLGTKNFSPVKLKSAFYNLGCSYRMSVNNEKTTLHLTGPESNLKACLKIANEIINELQSDEEKTKKLLDDLKAERKIERKEPINVCRSLAGYVLYGDKSESRQEYSTGELKKLKGSDIISAFKEANHFGITLNYTGKLKLEDVLPAVKQNIDFDQNIEPSKAPVIHKKLTYENEVEFFVVNKKNARQSQIMIHIEGSNYKKEKLPVIKGFNYYFGDDMSSIVFQEIREFRSLAYSAYATYNPPRFEDHPASVKGYIGCQGDKTNEAIETMLGLLKDLPQKPERMDDIRQGIIRQSQSARPSFRNVLSSIQELKKAGYLDDPNKLNLNDYENMSFKDINDFYSTEIQNRKIVVMVVGETKNFDLKKLKEQGKLTMIKQNQLFVN